MTPFINFPVRAHPRSRGENDDTGGESRVINGSSPLTRGKRVRDEGRASRRGLIPAHAGKTPNGQTDTSGLWAHPRSRGENSTNFAMILPLTGSSPLTRGKLGVGVVPGYLAGLIPAHAGKTITRLTPVITYGAHPRSRGENTQSGVGACW